MKKIVAFLLGLVISTGIFLGVIIGTGEKVSAYTNISQITDFSVYGSTHGKEALSNLSNPTNRIYLYEQLYKAAIAFWENQSDLTQEWEGAYVIKAIDISEYGLSPNEVVETYYSFQNDNPIFYFASNTVSLNGTEVMFLTDADYRQSSVRNQCKTYIINGLNEFSQLFDGKTNDAKILAAYEKVMARIEYAYESDGVTPLDTPWSHNIMGYFDTTINKGVCECYANVLHLVLNMAGIDNYFVAGESNGEAHAWNMAKFGDGNYYYLDATWDDEQKGFGYFAKGKIFEEDHHKHWPNGGGSLYLYPVPDAPATDYIFPVSGNIASVEDFKKIELNPSGSYTLTANLDFSNVKATKQDDYFVNTTFKGTLNGNGHTISGLTFGLMKEIGEGATVSNIKLKADFGSKAWKGNQSFYYIYKSALAENNRGTVKNCDLTYVMNDCSITGLQGVCIGGLLYANYGTVDSCDNSITVKNFAYSNNTNFLVQVSSVAVFHWGGTIKNCTVNVDITNSSVYTDIRCHGIVSEMESGTIIDNCTSNGSVVMGDKGSMGFGGIVNNNYGGTVSNCTNNCDVDASTGTSMASGGIVISNISTIYDDGSIKSISIIKNCTNNGDIYNRYTPIMESYSREVAGICPNNSGTITGCKNTGNVTTEIGTAGGIFGVCSGNASAHAIVSDCINTGKITGIQKSSWMNCVGGIGGEIAYDSGTNFDENGVLILTPGGSTTIKNCTNSGNIVSEYGAGCIVGNINLAAPGSAATITGCTNSGWCSNHGNWEQKEYYQLSTRSDGTATFSESANTNSGGTKPSTPVTPEVPPTEPKPSNPAPNEPDTEENTTESEKEETTPQPDEEETTQPDEEETTSQPDEEETTKEDEDDTTTSEDETTTDEENKDDDKKDKNGIDPIIVILIVVVVLGVVAFLIIRKKKASNVEEN